jgi:hypothetical protein
MADRLMAQMAGYLNNRRRKGGSGDFRRNKMPWRQGRTNIRILPFEHRVTLDDVQNRQGRCSLHLSEEDIGKVYTFTVVPGIRYFRGSISKPEGVVNGLGVYECPMFQEFLAGKDQSQAPEAERRVRCQRDVHGRARAGRAPVPVQDHGVAGSEE